MDVKFGPRRRLSAEELMPSNCSAGGDSQVPWTARRSNLSILRRSVLNIHWKDWCWSWSSNYFGHLMWRADSLGKKKKTGHWKRLRARGKGDDRGWGGWMASLTQGTWVWANSTWWWRTRKPGVLVGLQSQTLLSNWIPATKNSCTCTPTCLNWTDWATIPGLLLWSYASLRLRSTSQS